MLNKQLKGGNMKNMIGDYDDEYINCVNCDIGTNHHVSEIVEDEGVFDGLIYACDHCGESRYIDADGRVWNNSSIEIN